MQDSEKSRPYLYNEGLIWTRYACLMLGLWLLVSPLSFTTTSSLTRWNDIVVGVLLMIFGALSLNPKRLYAPWILFFLGIWLQGAPLIFWAPQGLTYLNETLTGALVILFSTLISGIPGERVHQGAKTPPGWSYNPSSWLQRMPVITFAFFCWLIARYMAAYQLGYLDAMWDPAFGAEGTIKVITSHLSKQFPVSDAGLGAAVYTLETLFGCKGGEERWSSMPWIVVLFGILVVPAGLVSILLIISQPLIVGHWCFWCLLTAVFMLIMVALTFDEVIAVIQFLVQSKKRGLPFWRTLWKGGEVPITKEAPPPPSLSAPLKALPAMYKGLSLTWNLTLTTLLGIWLMIVPSVVELKKGAQDNDFVVGALVITFSLIAMAEVVRTLRFLVTLLAIWSLVSQFFFDNSSLASLLIHILTAVALILFSLPRGKIREQYGSWNRYII